MNVQSCRGAEAELILKSEDLTAPAVDEQRLEPFILSFTQMPLVLIH